MLLKHNPSAMIALRIYSGPGPTVLLAAFIALICVVPSICSADVEVVQVDGDVLTLSAGQTAGVKVGMTGRVIHVEVTGGERVRLIVALFRVTAVQQTTSTARVQEVGPGFTVHTRMAVEFDQALEPPAPARPAVAILEIRSNVTGDVAYLDGRRLGATPQRVEVAPGNYVVRVEKAGYEPAEQRVVVSAGEEQTVRLQLQAEQRDPAMLLRTANEAYEARRWSDAVRLYEEFLVEMPGHGLATERVAVARRELEQARRAEVEVRRLAEERERREREEREARARELANVPVYQETARVYLASGQYQEAAEWLQKIETVTPGSDFVTSAERKMREALASARRSGDDVLVRSIAMALLVFREDAELQKLLFAVDMVLIQPGTYRRGSPASEAGRDSDESQHTVTISRAFYMGKTEVTQGQWQRVMGSNPSRFRGDDLPVEMVTWFDAVRFCNKLSELEGLRPAYRIQGEDVTWDRGANGYRLPTEAEWEYACRAGTTTRYHTGNSEADLGRAGWYDGNAGSKTHPVGRKQANAWGLHDMHGNVWEWCWDWYGRDYPSGQVTDPVGPGSGSSRVLRGGSWGDYARYCRSAHRYADDPSVAFDDSGFRLTRSAL